MPLTINGQSIDDDLIDSEFSQIKAYYESLGNISCCERDDEFRDYAKSNIIARVLLTQKAQEAITDVPDDRIDAEWQRLVEEHGSEDAMLSAMNVAPDQKQLLRDHIAESLRVELLLDDRLGAAPQPDEAAVQEFYEDNVAQYMTDERIHAAHILKNPTKSEDRAEAYEELRDVRRRIIAGEDFDALAKVHSDKVTEQAEALADGSLDEADAHDPVDLGWFSRGELVEEFELVAFSLEVNEVSPVFASAFGYHIVKLLGREPSTPKPLDEVRERVEADRLATWRDERVRIYVEKLKESAEIEDTEADLLGEETEEVEAHDEH